MKKNYEFEIGDYETWDGREAKVLFKDSVSGKLFGVVKSKLHGWQETSWDLDGIGQAPYSNPDLNPVPPKAVFWVCQKVSEPTAIVVFNGEDAADEFAQTMRELNSGDYRTIKVEEVGQ
jgi:hypothetical protein